MLLEEFVIFFLAKSSIYEGGEQPTTAAAAAEQNATPELVKQHFFMVLLSLDRTNSKILSSLIHGAIKITFMKVELAYLTIDQLISVAITSTDWLFLKKIMVTTSLSLVLGGF